MQEMGCHLLEGLQPRCRFGVHDPIPRLLGRSEGKNNEKNAEGPKLPKKWEISIPVNGEKLGVDALISAPQKGCAHLCRTHGSKWASGALPTDRPNIRPHAGLRWRGRAPLCLHPLR